MKRLILFVSSIIVGVLLGLKYIEGTSDTGDMGYKRLFSGDEVETMLLLGGDGYVFLKDINEEQLENTNIEADYLIGNEDYSRAYAIKTEQDQLAVTILQIDEEELKTEEKGFELEEPLGTGVEFKALNETIFFLDDSIGAIRGINLENDEIRTIMELDEQVLDWEVTNNDVYVLTETELIKRDLSSGEVLTMDRGSMEEIDVKDGILSVYEKESVMGFITHYNETFAIIGGTAFETLNAGFIKSTFNEPYTYYYVVNPQGGIEVEVEDLESNESYWIDLKTKDIKGELFFYNGNGYYINNQKEGVLRLSSGNKIISGMENGVKTIIPIYN